MLALLPTTDAPRDDPPGIPRDHSRGYFTVESIARYYPIAGPRFESWLGLTGGLVVVSDSFKNQETESDRQLVGPRGATIRTEGITAGVAGWFGLGARLSCLVARVCESRSGSCPTSRRRTHWETRPPSRVG